MNKGGTIDVKGLRITMTDARHSSSFDDNGIVYLGEAAGFVVKLENGQTIYFAGDTALFGDMKLIGELYKPDIAFLPIGDRFTMGPDTAAMAAKWLGVKQVVPMHYGTFPLLTGTPEQLEAAPRRHGNRSAEAEARRDRAVKKQSRDEDSDVYRTLLTAAVRRPDNPRTRRQSGPRSSGPPGSNHFEIQFTAPIIANSIIFGSPGLNTPWSMPCWMIARMP